MPDGDARAPPAGRRSALRELGELVEGGEPGEPADFRRVPAQRWSNHAPPRARRSQSEASVRDPGAVQCGREAGDELQVAAVPAHPRVFAHQALRSPAMADLLGHEYLQVRIMVVVHAHGRGVGDAEPARLGDEAELGVADAAIGFVEADGLEHVFPHRHVAGIGLGAVAGAQPLQVGVIAALEQP